MISKYVIDTNVDSSPALHMKHLHLPKTQRLLNSAQKKGAVG
jgi:hypothetical protein